MVGAGAVGTGGAIAASGGVVSIIFVIVFGYLAKKSSDLVISFSTKAATSKQSLLSYHNNQHHNGNLAGRRQMPPEPVTFEELGHITFGVVGKAAVALSKFGFAFGCCIAYVHLVKSNFASAAYNLLFGRDTNSSDGDRFPPILRPCITLSQSLLRNETLFTVVLSTVVILPLCLLRELSVLARASVIKIMCMYSIVFIIVYLYLYGEVGRGTRPVENPSTKTTELADNLTYERWIQVRPGLLQSLGTFLFTFIAHHTVNITYESMRHDLRSESNFEFVSAVATTMCAMIVLLAGLFSYCTFWLDTSSDLFDVYPELAIVDLAKVLLCIAMLLTYPMAFFSCRDLVITSFFMPAEKEHGSDQSRTAETTRLLGEGDDPGSPEAVIKVDNSNTSWLLPNEERQLRLPYHVTLSVLLWVVTVALALLAPSLGAVLNVVGCTSGSAIGFILPALFSLRINGYTHFSTLILAVGIFIGFIGSYYSVLNLSSTG
jgi:amino acid permease